MEIKNCPFCDAQPNIYKSTIIGSCIIQCNNCDFSFSERYKDSTSIDHSIESLIEAKNTLINKWNTRRDHE